MDVATFDVSAFSTRAMALELEINSHVDGVDLGLQGRKMAGAFYTPLDAAKLTWKGVLNSIDSSDHRAALSLVLKEFDIIDPCCGTGIFLLAFIDLVRELGCIDQCKFGTTKFYVNDLNSYACQHVAELSRELGIGDFVSISRSEGTAYLRSWDGSNRPLVIGNPPYASLRASGKYKYANSSFKHLDIYAEFVDAAVDLASSNGGAVGFVIPLSLSFSRDFETLRRKVYDLPGEKFFFNFDNIPDSIFCSGKPDSKNTNRANSQRVSIFAYCMKQNSAFFSSKLLSWRRHERAEVLSRLPETVQVNPFGPRAIIPKPASTALNELIVGSEFSVSDFIVSEHELESYSLYFCTTARNFLSVGLESFRTSGISKVSFSDIHLRTIFFLFLGSKTGLNIWKTLGDGFHVTNENILLFPISAKLIEHKEKLSKIGHETWAKRLNFQKQKLNAGKNNITYDFTRSCNSEIFDGIFA